MMQRLELTTGKFHLQEIKSNAHELLFALDSHCGGDFLYLCVDVMISKTCVYISLLSIILTTLYFNQAPPGNITYYLYYSDL